MVYCLCLFMVSNDVLSLRLVSKIMWSQDLVACKLKGPDIEYIVSFAQKVVDFQVSRNSEKQTIYMSHDWYIRISDHFESIEKCIAQWQFFQFFKRFCPFVSRLPVSSMEQRATKIELEWVINSFVERPTLKFYVTLKYHTAQFASLPGSHVSKLPSSLSPPAPPPPLLLPFEDDSSPDSSWSTPAPLDVEGFVGFSWPLPLDPSPEPDPAPQTDP